MNALRSKPNWGIMLIALELSREIQQLVLRDFLAWWDGNLDNLPARLRCSPSAAVIQGYRDDVVMYTCIFRASPELLQLVEELLPSWVWCQQVHLGGTAHGLAQACQELGL